MDKEKKQGSLSSENANVDVLPVTKIMAEKFNITSVLWWF